MVSTLGRMKEPIFIVGCTASGKSDLAEALALKLGAAILCVDCMQVYQGMDIGSAKPTPASRARIEHFMLDLVPPSASFNVADFTAPARDIIARFTSGADPRPLIIVGGTIFYLRALIEGLFDGPSADPARRARLQAEADTAGPEALHQRLQAIDPRAAARIHAHDLMRVIRALEVYEITGQPITELQTQWQANHPAMSGIFIGIQRDKDLLNRRINSRVRLMLEQGLVDEVQHIQATTGFSPEAASGVGYRQILDYLEGKITLTEAGEEIKIRTRHLAKSQRTWLKRYHATQWLTAEENQSGSDLCPAALELLNQHSIRPQ